MLHGRSEAQSRIMLQSGLCYDAFVFGAVAKYDAYVSLQRAPRP
jgi:hypothetical protein